MSDRHLTDEQFTGILLGAGSPAAQAHLSVCPRCAEEAAQVAGAVGDFQSQSRLWAERRSATHLPVAAGLKAKPSWSRRPQAWTAAALVVVFATAAGLAIHREGRSTPSTAVAHTMPLSPATLKADNDLLTAIDGELQADDSTSASSYSPGSTPRSNPVKTAKRMVSE